MLHSPDILTGLDESIQKYARIPMPPGHAVIYAYVRTSVLKAYIGQSTVNAFTRKESHWRRKDGCRAIHAALRKHGRKAFRFVILALCPKEEADDLEVALIAKHGTQGKNRGYNILEGGKRACLTPDILARIQTKRKITVATEESKAKRAKGARNGHARQSTIDLREERRTAKRDKMIADAWAAAVPDVEPTQRQHGAFYIRGGKVFRYYLPPGRTPGRGNFTEVSKEAMEARNKDSKARMRKKRGMVEG